MTREEIKKAMRDTKKEVVLKNLHKLLSLVEGYSEYEDCVGYAIETLEQEPTTKNDLGVDCILRADVERAIEDVLQSDNCDYDLREFLADLKDIPSATPIRPKGHWIWCVGSHKCSNCEEYTCFSHKELLRYCPNCGADMREVVEE